MLPTPAGDDHLTDHHSQDSAVEDGGAGPAQSTAGQDQTDRRDQTAGPDLTDGRNKTAGPDQSAGPDQTDRVIIAAAQELGADRRDGLVVVDDATGELTAFALSALTERAGARVLSWTSSLAAALVLQERFAAEITAGRLLVPAGPQVVPLEQAAAELDGPLLALMRLPKALLALEDRARSLAAAARDRGEGGLELVAGGRVKHMTRTQNEVLAGVFSEVRASRGIGKSRALIGTGVRGDAAGPSELEGSTRISVRGEKRSLALRGRGAVFAGAGADAGSLLLLGSLDRAVTAGELASAEVAVHRAVDLGSGNGLMTSYLAALLPDALVLGSDDDADAVASTRATLAANGLERDGVDVTWDDALSRVEDRSVDLVLLNPPFHDGTAVDATLVDGLLDAAVRVLRPGGQLWFVHNSHLRIRTEVERRVGPVRQRSRDRRFTVLSALRV